MKTIKLFWAFYAPFIFLACNAGSNNDVSDFGTDSNYVDLPEPIVLEQNGVKLTEVVGSPQYPDAILSMKSPKSGVDLEPVNLDFEFSIVSKSYKLTDTTSDATTKGCANSDKGQHIHLIIDNQPYEAAYDTNYTTKESLTAGNHVVLAFLSRSYHESLKHKGAAVLSQFTIGDDQMDAADLKAAHMFYSRPKGEYKASDVNQVMLDFYLVNTEISENGNYVVAVINDKSEFKITKWAPYMMSGLPLGENKIVLKLMDKDGKLIPGPFNAVEKHFTLLQ